ncbi:MAG: hypothetical protein ACU85E_15430, partial [Gammaproteobacteria bacterium]
MLSDTEYGIEFFIFFTDNPTSPLFTTQASGQCLLKPGSLTGTHKKTGRPTGLAGSWNLVEAAGIEPA